MYYFDNSATTRPDPRVVRVMNEAQEEYFGNPSSLHRLGLASEKAISKARRQMAESLAAKPEQVFFNSCGTEGNNTVFFGASEAYRRTGNKIITTRVEHPAVLEAAAVLEKKGFQVVYLEVDSDGKPDLDQLKAEMNEQVILVSCMTVNNETGTIMPIREISRIVHDPAYGDRFRKQGGALLHTDFVQGFGKLLPETQAVDFLTVSAHKFHGPKGMGVLYMKEPNPKIRPLIVGGGQEKHFRSGTENVAGILGTAEAARLASETLAEENRQLTEIQTRLKEGILDQIPDVRINTPEDSSPAVLNVSFLGTRGEVILHRLESDEIYVSTGSACSSNKKGRSHVLAAMGRSDKEIEGAIRFSFGRFNTLEEVDFVLDRVKKAVAGFRRLGSFR